MLTALASCCMQSQCQALFELQAVYQIGQRIMAGMVGQLHRIFLAQFQFLELSFSSIYLADHALRKQNAERSQYPCYRQDNQQQRRTYPACCLAQCIRKSVLPRADFFIYLENAIQNHIPSSKLHAAYCLCRMEFFSSRIQALDEFIASFPDVDYAFHVTHAVKPRVQTDDPRYIGRMCSTFYKASPYRGIIWIRFFKF